MRSPNHKAPIWIWGGALTSILRPSPWDARFAYCREFRGPTFLRHWWVLSPTRETTGLRNKQHVVRPQAESIFCLFPCLWVDGVTQSSPLNSKSFCRPLASPGVGSFLSKFSGLNLQSCCALWRQKTEPTLLQSSSFNANLSFPMIRLKWAVLGLCSSFYATKTVLQFCSIRYWVLNKPYFEMGGDCAEITELPTNGRNPDWLRFHHCSVLPLDSKQKHGHVGQGSSPPLHPPLLCFALALFPTGVQVLFVLLELKQ